MLERFKPNPYTGKPMYYKDNPNAVRKRDAQRMYVNGKEISKKHPLHKPGRFKSLDDAWSHSKIESTEQGDVYVIQMVLGLSGSRLVKPVLLKTA